MFKSIHYKIGLYIVLIILSTAGATLLIVERNYLYVIPVVVVLAAGLFAINSQFKKFNQNIIFLLDALNNGDYTFHFSETKRSTREKELNRVMNRIREILSNAREEVIENEKFLSIVIETVPVGLMIMDEQGGITSINRSALQWFGLSSLTHINQLGKENKTYPALFLKLRPGDSSQLTITNEREELQISLRVTEIRLKQGVMKLITLNNIGNELESREIESWIRLIRVMTHEIMNSIAPITSLSDTMLSVLRSGSTDNRNLKKNTEEAFETIHATAKGLLSFVESYRKFTAIPQPEMKPFSTGDLLVQAVNLHTQAAAEKNIRIQIVASGDINLYADKNLIMQVLVNLLKNAIEAANVNGEIQIHCTRQNSGKTVIDVANTGLPIPKDVLPFIFIPFFTTKANGSGIGLSVSRYIMRLHGGNLIHSISPNGMTVFSMVFT
jgi:nitrogen fixation/metabolism regulation signal transduction histidine kinase